MLAKPVYMKGTGKSGLFLSNLGSRKTQSWKGGCTWCHATQCQVHRRSMTCMALNSDKNAVVVGAGVIGLTTAVRLLENGWNVSCVAECITGDPGKVASAGAGGLWYPYLTESSGRTGRWANETRAIFEEMHQGESGKEAGVALKDCWQCYVPGEEIPPWAPDCPSFRLMSREEVEEKYQPNEVLYDIGDDFLAYSFEAPIIQVELFLKYLRNRIEDMGGKLAEERVESLDNVEADLIVNCAGIGNSAKVEGLEKDKDLNPVRGQIVHLKNTPAVSQAVTISANGETSYIIPRGDITVLGGTSDEGEWDTKVREDIVDEILKRAAKLLPLSFISDLEVVGHWVGLRPYRSSGIKLEKEELHNGKLVVHNYGHGGAGITLCWGCADEVVRMSNAA